MQEFKQLLKAHSDNVQQRQTRVSKYGGGSSSSSSGRENDGVGGLAALSQNYAMFSHAGSFPMPSVPVAAPSSSSSSAGIGNAELRRRNVTSQSASGFPIQRQQQQVQMTRARYQQAESFRSAQKVEASLAQVWDDDDDDYYTHTLT